MDCYFFIHYLFLGSVDYPAFEISPVWFVDPAFPPCCANINQSRVCLTPLQQRAVFSHLLSAWHRPRHSPGESATYVTESAVDRAGDALHVVVAVFLGMLWGQKKTTAMDQNHLCLVASFISMISAAEPSVDSGEKKQKTKKAENVQ